MNVCAHVADFAEFGSTGLCQCIQKMHAALHRIYLGIAHLTENSEGLASKVVGGDVENGVFELFAQAGSHIFSELVNCATCGGDGADHHVGDVAGWVDRKCSLVFPVSVAVDCDLELIADTEAVGAGVALHKQLGVCCRMARVELDPDAGFHFFQRQVARIG